MRLRLIDDVVTPDGRLTGKRGDEIDVTPPAAAMLIAYSPYMGACARECPYPFNSLPKIVTVIYPW